MTAIPDQQLTPPAGHETALAYRPACEQLQPSRGAGGVTWGVMMPDGTPYALASGLPTMSEVEAHLWLDAAGLCKDSGVVVPIQPPTAVTIRPQAIELVEVERSLVSSGLILTIGGGLVLAALIYWVLRPRERPSQAKQTQSLEEFLNGH